MRIAFTGKPPARIDAIVVAATRPRRLAAAGRDLDVRSGGAIARAMAAGRFTGDAEQILDIPAPSGIDADRIVVVGLGAKRDIGDLAVENMGGSVVGHLNRVGAKSAAIVVEPWDGEPPAAVAGRAARAAFGARLGSYRFDKYKTKQKPQDKPTLQRLVIVTPRLAAAKAAYERLARIADGVFFSRDLVSEPANVIYPESLAAQAETLSRLGVDVEELHKADIEKLGMGALLGVAQGSARDPRVVIMQWNGSPKGLGDPPIAFVGKGVTFDTGGISIKPAGGMEDMKWDMAGSAVVIGLMKALAGRNAPVNAVGVVGLVENMPSATAQRPGDVVRTMSGQTIEVVNTDAEGRLVLADALWYCQNRFKPRAMIDLATLTGAIIVALGSYKAGLFANNDALARQLAAAGDAVGEELWRMPLGKRYDKDIESDIADMKNVGKNREAGSIAGAVLLQRFVGRTPWAHLDIAGVAWSKTDAPTVPKGGTGFGVRLLDRLVADHFEG